MSIESLSKAERHNRQNYIPVENQQIFSEFRSYDSVTYKRKMQNKNTYSRKPARFYNWNQPLKHFKRYLKIVKARKK